jgi:hypothetical protein
MGDSAVARVRGLKMFVLIVFLGLAPQALCFRPLRGLGSQDTYDTA